MCIRDRVCVRDPAQRGQGKIRSLGPARGNHPSATKGARRGLSISEPLREYPETAPPSETTDFAHNSERQFAKLLDFYQIEWEYEPKTFDLEWDPKRVPTLRFTPDFYLPKYEVFIEITTLNQKLVTKKNRKVRRLRELYPQIKCKIFYQRDYLSLLVKYGLEQPSQLRLADEEASAEADVVAEVEPDPGDGGEGFLKSVGEA